MLLPGRINQHYTTTSRLRIQYLNISQRTERLNVKEGSRLIHLVLVMCTCATTNVAKERLKLVLRLDRRCSNHSVTTIEVLLTTRIMLICNVGLQHALLTTGGGMAAGERAIFFM